VGTRAAILQRRPNGGSAVPARAFLDYLIPTP